MYRCRKCRQNLNVQDSVIKEIPYCTDASACQSSVLYLDVDTCPEWIVHSFEQTSWTKGKLLCVKCNGRLGSFDFVYKKVCKCLQHPIPLVHLLKDRIDVIETRHISRTPFVPQHRQIEKPNSCTESSDVVLRNDISTAAINKEDSNAIPFSEIINKDRNLPFVEDIIVESQKDNHQAACNSLPHTSQGASFLQPDNSCNDPPEDLPEIAINLHEQERGLPEENDPLLDEDLNLPEFDDVNAYAVLDCEELELEDYFAEVDGSVQETEMFGVERHKHKRRKNKRMFKALKKNRMKPKKLKAESNVSRDSNEIKGEDSKEDFNISEDWIEQGHDIPPDLTCGICLELYYSPHHLDPCKHIFCENCLRMMCRQTPTLTRCPLCRRVIHKCVFDNELTEKIKVQYDNLYKQRHHDMRRKRASYPLPCSTHSQRRMEQFGHYPDHGNAQESIINRCFHDILTRFAWLLLLFVVHNILFMLDTVFMWDLYAPISVKYNSYLFRLAGKLILFGILHIVRKAIRINLDQTIGHLVSFVFIFSVLLDGNSWVNSLLNLVMIGSLFL
ncbi:E3 ubiquitin-protein ligase RNF180-like [Ruditapes philippinarum]|uniref:E3 ubiquitin-protein ligase RNF180-like n=1 Tax=Ruditapes philippinarum TaxID=129788 RepID=UPI00295AFBEF|nr:E3 ubiquitin-protein ligase RNF180-like [Ruditapes philippinarum]XP_060565095.1 E3 ubiquitin-protein ligase RNF180-like [Ruditapes philippinarum]